MKLRYILPLFLFLGIIILLWRGLNLHPTLIPTPLINKPAPSFQLPTLLGPQKTVTNQNFLGHVTLLNIWATWCYACQEEHAFLMQLAQDEHVIFYGLNYKDDQKAAKKWLQQYGNPYQVIMVDATGNTAIDWGVYGTPETFIIDKKAVIRYKLVGPITPSIWKNDLQPLIKHLQENTK